MRIKKYIQLYYKEHGLAKEAIKMYMDTWKNPAEFHKWAALNVFMQAHAQVHSPNNDIDYVLMSDDTVFLSRRESESWVVLNQISNPDILNIILPLLKSIFSLEEAVKILDRL